VAARIDIAGVTLAYEDTGGAGPAVLFVHGLGGSANGWLAQLEACRERGWRGVAHDQRGAGRSAVPEEPFSVEGWAEDACALLGALEIERAALVGHSVGCMIAEQAALRLQDRVWALALCGGMQRWPEEGLPAFEERARLARSGRMDENAEAVAGRGLSERCKSEDPRLLGLLREAVASNEPEGYARWAEATAHGRMEGLERLRCPVLAFCGSEDHVTPPQASQAIAESVADGRTGSVAGAAHWCMLEDPEGTNETLFAFLRECAPDA
jgi:3-oxoadipate enol-lactonase